VEALKSKSSNQPEIEELANLMIFLDEKQKTPH